MYNPMMRLISFLAITLMAIAVNAKTLIVYYSYTNNVHKIVVELAKQIEADVVRIEPKEKGIDYAANNYAIGSAQISAIRNKPSDPASYPAIDDVEVDFDDYDCVIVGAPLWWSNMAAPLQTFLFENGKALAGKKIGLIVSSSSSSIGGVEGDLERLVPGGDILTPSLWIRSAQTSNAATMIADWLKATGLADVADTAMHHPDQNNVTYTIFSTDGKLVGRNLLTLQSLNRGLYIVNGKKLYITNFN